jgi:hypothetical protein
VKAQTDKGKPDVDFGLPTILAEYEGYSINNSATEQILREGYIDFVGN